MTGGRRGAEAGLRLGFVTSARIPSRTANAVHVLNLASAVAGEGCDVTLFARGGGVDPERLRADFALPEPFALSLRPLRRPALLDRLAYLRHVRRGLRGCDFAYGRSCYALLGGVPANIPFAYDLHMLAEGAGRRLESLLFRRGNFRFATAISRALADAYVARYPHLAGRILVAPCAARPADDPSPAPRVSGAPLRVYYVGHLYEGRGIELIAALARLEPEMEFHLVGGEEADIARRAGGAPPNMVFHGYVKPADLGAHYAAADVCIAPHQRKVLASGGGEIGSWMSPMKLFEYMAQAKPILAADLPAIRELLSDGETALLCEPGNVEAWRAALRRLADDPALRERLAAAGLATLRARYTWEARARAILDRAAAELRRG